MKTSRKIKESAQILKGPAPMGALRLYRTAAELHVRFPKSFAKYLPTMRSYPQAPPKLNHCCHFCLCDVFSGRTQQANF